jgi:hypothetical protein
MQGLLVYSKTNIELGRRGDQVKEELGVEAAPSLLGSRRFTHKVVGFLGCFTKPRMKARQAETGFGRVGKL